jgi:hypothetical protein
MRRRSGYPGASIHEAAMRRATVEIYSDRKKKLKKL